MAGHDPYGQYGQYGTSKYPSHRGHHPQDRAAGSQQGHPEHGRQQWGQPDARGQAGAWGQPGEEPDDQRGSWYQQPPPDAPRKPGQKATPSRRWYRRTWVAAAAALLLGIILGNLSGGGDAEPAVAEAGVPPEAATPGSCLRVIDLARGGKVNSQEFEAASGDCRAKAAPAGGEQPVTAENPPTSTAPAPPTTAAVPTTTLQPQPVDMPDLARLNYATALEQLGELGVSVDRIDYTPLGQSSIMINPFDWLVLEQQPAAGEPLAPGDAIMLGVVDRDDPEAAGIKPRLG